VSTADPDKDPLSRADSPAWRMVQRLVDGSRVKAEGDRAADARAAACDRLYGNLSRWVGPDGCHALYTRALAQARTEHPALGTIELRARAVPYVDGVAATVAAHGDGETAEALDVLLFRLVELLDRLIGDDMASKLIERSLVEPEGRDATAGGARREA
jgi:hypothetical protein